MSSCDSVCLREDTLLFLIFFFLKDKSGGSQASRICSDDKMDGSWAETSKGLADIRVFPFVKNEVLCMLKIWTVLLRERLKLV